MAVNGRRRADEGLILALAAGQEVREAAAADRISERTAYRRLADPAFVRRVDTARSELAKQTAAQLTAAGAEAVTTLQALLRSETQPTVRLGAASAILELGPRHREAEDKRALFQRRTVDVREALIFFDQIKLAIYKVVQDRGMLRAIQSELDALRGPTRGGDTGLKSGCNPLRGSGPVVPAGSLTRTPNLCMPIQKLSFTPSAWGRP